MGVKFVEQHCISHLLFANDSFFFFRADEAKKRTVKDIFTTFKRASRQAINL